MMNRLVYYLLHEFKVVYHYFFIICPFHRNVNNRVRFWESGGAQPFWLIPIRALLLSNFINWSSKLARPAKIVYKINLH
jgi:paraquat-inducible protein B